MQQFCFVVIKIQEQGNELMKTTKLIPEYFPSKKIEVSRIAKEDGSRSILMGNKFPNVVLHN